MQTLRLRFLQMKCKSKTGALRKDKCSHEHLCRNWFSLGHLFLVIYCFYFPPCKQMHRQKFFSTIWKRVIVPEQKGAILKTAWLDSPPCFCIQFSSYSTVAQYYYKTNKATITLPSLLFLPPSSFTFHRNERQWNPHDLLDDSFQEIIFLCLKSQAHFRMVF